MEIWQEQLMEIKNRMFLNKKDKMIKGKEKNLKFKKYGKLYRQKQCREVFGRRFTG